MSILYHHRGAAVLIALLIAGSAGAAPDIPDKSGWSGHVAVGAGGGQAETNMIDSLFGISVGDDRIDALGGSPDSKNFVVPVLHFDVAYTIAGTGTQFYTRFQPSPHIFLDLETHVGIRQRLPDLGILDISMAGSAPVTRVWKDPYLVGANRGDTDRSITGLHMRWHTIMETPLTVEISSTEIEIDDEESGSSLPLSPDDQRLLRRTGQVYRYHVDYEWKLNERNKIVPAISYLDYQLDGDAMAEDGVAVQLEHQYTGTHWHLTTTVYYRDLTAKEDNPIFGQAADRQVFGAAVLAEYPEPFGWERWSANARLSWYDSDNDIDFYDETLGMIMLGAKYRLD